MVKDVDKLKEFKMELYKGKYWDVIFGVWDQDHPGYCIIENEKESLSELCSEVWHNLVNQKND